MAEDRTRDGLITYTTVPALHTRSVFSTRLLPVIEGFNKAIFAYWMMSGRSVEGLLTPLDRRLGLHVRIALLQE